MTRQGRATLPLDQFLVGDAGERLQQLPASSVDCVITSPPYFQLRDYGHPRQLGLERDINEWVTALRSVCQQVARVLKPTGSLWLNVGDRYSRTVGQGTTYKSLLLGPQRLALALDADGWIVRNQVIWAKRNPMPAGAADRFSSGYEVLLFLVRSRRYCFDLDAIRVPSTSRPDRRRRVGNRMPISARPGGNARETNAGLITLKTEGRVGHPLGKNPGDVWWLPVSQYRGEHFATFPEALVTPPLLTTCPARVCGRCGHPWRREPVDRRSPLPELGELRPDCLCGADAAPGVVLDPFAGAGTVALVAEQHGRHWLGIELNPVYAALARQRIAEARAQAASGTVRGSDAS